MNQKLSPEQSAALNESPGETLCVEDPVANRIYFVLDEDLARRAMRALEEQETWNELQESIAQAAADDTVSLSDADLIIRNRASLPDRS